MQKPTPFDKKILPDYEIYGSIVYEIVDIVKTIVRKKLHKKKGDWVHDHKRFHLHRRAGVHCRTAGVAATLHEVEILRLCTTYRSAVPHYHDSLHAGCMGHGGHQACLLRAEKQPAVCNDLPDAAALRHPQDHQAGSQDAGRLLCRFRLHLVGLHCHLRHHEGAPWLRSMEGTGRSVRQLDGRLRQHDRRAGCAGHRRS